MELTSSDITQSDSIHSKIQAAAGVDIDANVYEKSLSNDDAIQEVGFYTDGGDLFTQPQLAGLTGTATYKMEDGAVGFYNSGDDVDSALGDVELTANFDTDKISGKIDKIRFSESLTPLGLEIALEAADIDNSKEGGFWTGVTRTTNTEDPDVYVGTWGGQFYGDDGNPKFAAGTFGGIADTATNAKGAFVGSFIAKKE